MKRTTEIKIHESDNYGEVVRFDGETVFLKYEEKGREQKPNSELSVAAADVSSFAEALSDCYVDMDKDDDILKKASMPDYLKKTIGFGQKKISLEGENVSYKFDGFQDEVIVEQIVEGEVVARKTFTSSWADVVATVVKGIIEKQ